MFSQCRLILPAILQVKKVGGIRNIRHKFRTCYIQPSVHINKTQPRLYSSEAAPKVLLVDYEYTKKATSNTNVVIIDVREPDEVKDLGKIPNSVNIPLGTVKSALGDLSGKEFKELYNISKPAPNTEMIFYCMIGKRSGKAQEIATSLGYENTRNYVGSWTDWASKTQ